MPNSTRARQRLENARADVATCAISGAVGTFANVDPRVEEHVARAMGLTPEPISTQIIPRDRHAMFFATLAVIASSVERLATEIRHLQRTEVLEAEEYFSPGQKGSSAMPHKRNPVLSENLDGLARMVRAYALPALENVALWHERDISHSSVERMIGPDATVTLDFALARLTGLIDRLVVYPEAMQANLDRLGGLIHSQRVLLALTQAGLSTARTAYSLVQRNAMKVWEADADFLAELLADQDVRTVACRRRKSANMFDLGYHLKHVDTIFAAGFRLNRSRRTNAPSHSPAKFFDCKESVPRVGTKCGRRSVSRQNVIAWERGIRRDGELFRENRNRHALILAGGSIEQHPLFHRRRARHRGADHRLVHVRQARSRRRTTWMST